MTSLAAGLLGTGTVSKWRPEKRALASLFAVLHKLHIRDINLKLSWQSYNAVFHIYQSRHSMYLFLLSTQIPVGNKATGHSLPTLQLYNNLYCVDEASFTFPDLTSHCRHNISYNPTTDLQGNYHKEDSIQTEVKPHVAKAFIWQANRKCGQGQLRPGSMSLTTILHWGNARFFSKFFSYFRK